MKEILDKNILACDYSSKDSNNLSPHSSLTPIRSYYIVISIQVLDIHLFPYFDFVHSFYRLKMHLSRPSVEDET